MRVQPVILEENKIRYILIDNSGQPVIPVIKYLKHLDNTDKSRNTIKTYCYSLKLYFEFLNEIRKDYREINISDLSNFVGWLRNPYNNSKVLVLNPTKARRTEKTVNLTITAVTNFYDYLFRTEEVTNDIIEKLIKQVFTGGRKPYKDFLFHINKDKPINKNILIIKEPRRKLNVLAKDEVEEIYSAAINIRDKFNNIFKSETTLYNVFSNQNSMFKRLSEFINRKYPNLNSILDLDIDKASLEWVDWHNNKGIQTSRIRDEKSLGKEYTHKTSLAYI